MVKKNLLASNKGRTGRGSNVEISNETANRLSENLYLHTNPFNFIKAGSQLSAASKSNTIMNKNTKELLDNLKRRVLKLKEKEAQFYHTIPSIKPEIPCQDFEDFVKVVRNKKNYKEISKMKDLFNTSEFSGIMRSIVFNAWKVTEEDYKSCVGILENGVFIAFSSLDRIGKEKIMKKQATKTFEKGYKTDEKDLKLLKDKILFTMVNYYIESQKDIKKKDFNLPLLSKTELENILKPSIYATEQGFTFNRNMYAPGGYLGELWTHLTFDGIIEDIKYSAQKRTGPRNTLSPYDFIINGYNLQNKNSIFGKKDGFDLTQKITMEQFFNLYGSGDETSISQKDLTNLKYLLTNIDYLSNISYKNSPAMTRDRLSKATGVYQYLNFLINLLTNQFVAFQMNSEIEKSPQEKNIFYFFTTNSFVPMSSILEGIILSIKAFLTVQGTSDSDLGIGMITPAFKKNSYISKINSEGNKNWKSISQEKKRRLGNSGDPHSFIYPTNLLNYGRDLGKSAFGLQKMTVKYEFALNKLKKFQF